MVASYGRCVVAEKAEHQVLVTFCQRSNLHQSTELMKNQGRQGQKVENFAKTKIADQQAILASVFGCFFAQPPTLLYQEFRSCA